jgi:hypothetical protein
MKEHEIEGARTMQRFSCGFFIAKPEGKGQHRRLRVDGRIIKMDLKEI